MLVTTAIVKRPTCDEMAAGANEELIYGPVDIICRDNDASVIANKVIADAALAGKLPNGWNESMYVCGKIFRMFT